jgi:hypothetical protein
MSRVGNHADGTDQKYCRTELLLVSSFVPYGTLNGKDFYNLRIKTQSSDLKEMK